MKKMYLVMLWDDEISPAGPVFPTMEDAEKAIDWYKSSKEDLDEDSDFEIMEISVYDSFESFKPF